MSNIEPTEEQMQKGEQMYASSDYMTSRDFAEILAEREAKLREEMAEHRFYREQGAEERDTLRARVAELEALFAAATSARVADKMENLKREAQHLADIKATIDLLRNPFAPHIERVQLLQRLAHYDDAKADAPASTEGEVRDE